MNLRELAEADNAIILEDTEAGFGVPVKLTDLEDPANVYNVGGQYHRVGVETDPETGLVVPGNKSAVTVRLASLAGALPEEGWIVETTDMTGAAVKGRVVYTMLDRTAGRATLVLGR